MNTPDKRRSRRSLGLMALLFLAPVAVSFALYYGSGGSWRPKGDVSLGDLIVPARPLPEVALSTPDGKTTDSKFLIDKWSLIFIGRLENGHCDERCRQALYQIRQVRVSLNEKSERVQRVFLYSGECCGQPFFSTEHAGLIIASIDSPEGQRLLREFGDSGSTLTAGRIYISDPLGNLMMQYERVANPKDLREDLGRLLKLSHIG